MNTLSDQRLELTDATTTGYYPEEAVKSFIEQLKEDIEEALNPIENAHIEMIIDKLAGDKLT